MLFFYGVISFTHSQKTNNNEKRKVLIIVKAQKSQTPTGLARHRMSVKNKCRTHRGAHSPVCFHFFFRCALSVQSNLTTYVGR